MAGRELPAVELDEAEQAELASAPAFQDPVPLFLGIYSTLEERLAS